MSFVMIEVPPEVTPESSALEPTATFTSRHAHQDFHKVLQQGMGLEHIRPFLDAIMQLKPANTGILLRDNGDAD
jgi:hypothetical protein